MSYAAAVDPKYKLLGCCVQQWLYIPASGGTTLCQTDLLQLLFHPLFTSLSIGFQATYFLFPSHHLFKDNCWCEGACPQLKVGQISYRIGIYSGITFATGEERKKKSVDGRLKKIKQALRYQCGFYWSPLRWSVCNEEESFALTILMYSKICGLI